MCHVGTGDDQRIEALFLDGVERFVVTIDVRLPLRAALEFLERKRVHVELRDGVGFADQPEELPFGGGQRRIGHHVEQADVQLADFLVERDIARQHRFAFLAQALEGGQQGIGNQWHEMDLPFL